MGMLRKALGEGALTLKRCAIAHDVLPLARSPRARWISRSVAVSSDDVASSYRNKVKIIYHCIENDDGEYRGHGPTKSRIGGFFNNILAIALLT
jgi:hypothetical protein